MNINHFTDGIDNPPFHSNGYAKAANGNDIGAASSQSFTQRLHVERNRRHVRKYHNSMIANGHHRHSQFHRIDVVNNAPERPEQPGVSSRSTSIQGKSPLSGRSGVGRSISGFTRPVNRPSFSEPSTRGFNPYK